MKILETYKMTDPELCEKCFLMIRNPNLILENQTLKIS